MQNNAVDRSVQIKNDSNTHTTERTYQPERDEFEQVKAELRALHGNLLMLYEAKDVGFDQVQSLTSLSQKLDDTNAKLKMLIRSLKLRQTSLTQ